MRGRSSAGYNACLSRRRPWVRAPSSPGHIPKDYGEYGSSLPYSAAGTPLPTCGSSMKASQAIVGNASSPTYTYMDTYTSGGRYDLCVEDTLDASFAAANCGVMEVASTTARFRYSGFIPRKALNVFIDTVSLRNLRHGKLEPTSLVHDSMQCHRTQGPEVELRRSVNSGHAALLRGSTRGGLHQPLARGFVLTFAPRL